MSILADQMFKYVSTRLLADRAGLVAGDVLCEDLDAALQLVLAAHGQTPSQKLSSPVQ
jgi:hypothetical protein